MRHAKCEWYYGELCDSVMDMLYLFAISHEKMVLAMLLIHKLFTALYFVLKTRIIYLNEDSI